MSKFLTEEFSELVAYLGDILRNIVGLYVGGAWNEKHLLVVSPGCLAEALLRHIKRVSALLPAIIRRGLLIRYISSEASQSMRSIRLLFV